jgi:hypothetical protein
MTLIDKGPTFNPFDKLAEKIEYQSVLLTFLLVCSSIILLVFAKEKYIYIGLGLLCIGTFCALISFFKNAGREERNDLLKRINEQYSSFIKTYEKLLDECKEEKTQLHQRYGQAIKDYENKISVLEATVGKTETKGILKAPRKEFSKKGQ